MTTLAPEESVCPVCGTTFPLDILCMPTLKGFPSLRAVVVAHTLVAKPNKHTALLPRTKRTNHGSFFRSVTARQFGLVDSSKTQSLSLF